MGKLQNLSDDEMEMDIQPVQKPVAKRNKLIVKKNKNDNNKRSQSASIKKANSNNILR